jgi:GGDEF domain-containing protein
MFFTISSLLCYIFINIIKREYGADFNQTIWFNYLVILYPLNIILFYLYGRFRFISSKSLHMIMLILLEYGVVDLLGKHNVNLSIMVGKINILAAILYFGFVMLFLVKSIQSNNSYNYSTLYSAIAIATGIYFSNSASGLSLFFFSSQLIIFIDLIFTLTYNYFYDETTGFYSRNSYLIKSKNFPFKYNLGIISIDNYDKLLKAFGYKKQKILTNLIAEVVQELTSEEVVFRYAQDQFVVLYKDQIYKLANCRKKPVAYIAEELARQDEETLHAHHLLTDALGSGIVQSGVVKIGVASIPLALVDIVGDVLADVAIEEHTENVCLEVPSIYRTSHLIGDRPYCSVEFCTLHLLLILCHNQSGLLYSSCCQ